MVIPTAPLPNSLGDDCVVMGGRLRRNLRKKLVE